MIPEESIAGASQSPEGVITPLCQGQQLDSILLCSLDELGSRSISSLAFSSGSLKTDDGKISSSVRFTDDDGMAKA